MVGEPEQRRERWRDGEIATENAEREARREERETVYVHKGVVGNVWSEAGLPVDMHRIRGRRRGSRMSELPHWDEREVKSTKKT